MIKGKKKNQAPQLDLKRRKNTNQSDYDLMLNGKHVRSVSKTGLYFPNWRFETLQKKTRCINVIIQHHICLVKNNKL